ncbi:aspartate/glutamate racemase family protein [Fodinicola acaciae]|uniref:aspartate/glutamate racemase family protein n=1 Tax=Fodinicola acaciae TaxID=2681555 RepID=UPI0013D81EC0|nr:aspartate/glutamate racemase family protein [Fodinicola acaciae]
MTDIGVIMLDNDLPRPVGDIGNPRSFAYPIAYDVCPGAETTLVVEQSAVGLLEAVKATAARLRDKSVRAITTCCGFLAIYQKELAATQDVPVATSSLLQVPLVLRMLKPEQKVCVLTVNASTLTDRHLAAVGITERVNLVGLEHTEHFYPMIVGKRKDLDVPTAEAEVVAAATKATQDDPSIGAFVFECTNLPPYGGAVRAATGLPVWDALTMIDWLRAGVAA